MFPTITPKDFHREPKSLEENYFGNLHYSAKCLYWGEQ